jgi:DNA-binding response OmpR family regulator
MRDVLLVEDSETIRHLLTSALEKRGFRVVAVEHGPSVMEAARQALPSVIIMNKMLPGMDGHEVLAELRRNPLTAGMKVMMLTESKRKDDVVRSIEGGADDYVVKPFDPEEVASRVDTMIRRLQTGRPGPMT